MIQASQPNPAERVMDDFTPCLKNPAVALCNEVYLKIHKATRDQTRNLYTAERCAGIAFRLALPPLSGYQNICDFIACVGYGILLGAIKEKNSGKLLYAAQVALAAIPQHAKTQTRNEPGLNVLHPTTPPLSPQPPQKKRIKSIKTASNPQNKEPANSAA